MNLSSQAVKSMTMPSSSTCWRSGDGASDQFPAGLRVLVVDDDPTCLVILEKMLRYCRYEVTKCNRAEIALSLLRGNRNGFDIVLSDVHMPDMNGFKLLEHIGLEMDLPVIMMSADDSKSVVMKGVTHGACDYLIKPVRIEALKNIWQHVVRKRKNEWKELERSESLSDGERLKKPPEDTDYSSSANENWKSSKRKKEEEDEAEEREDGSSLKKPRVVWSVELHQQFVAAVNQLGIDKAVPKRILEMMSVPGLTRENVASHLQKYRLYLKRLSGVHHHQTDLGNSFMGLPDVSFGSIPLLNGFDLQALASTGRPNAKSSDQRNLFSFENPKLRYAAGQKQKLQNTGKQQINLLHGIPTNMEAKELVNLHRSAQAFGNRNSLVPSQSSQISQLRLTNRNHVSDFSINYSADLPGNSFAIGGSNSRASAFTSKESILEEISSEMKGTKGFVPSYDIFKTHDWDLQNIANIRGNLNGNVSQSDMFRNGQNSGQNSIPSNGKGLFSTGGELGCGNHRLADLGFEDNLFPEQFGQEDLMNLLLKQQQEEIGAAPAETDLGFVGYPLDNLPV